ncbi:site-2 protease family protein [Dermatobacter hominis]|uniref:site-2 protease family protein n=1 Tax=Dermatobacter hominis TaxID=2884263 RepID=UPI001D113607|nr:site-2 protease family protein [Dermatobacter hominis]UDY35669.1 site-2 protease family protein [Dermatobacter hominis]
MRTSGLRLGRILGIEVAADLGVLLFGGLLTWILATSILPASEPGRTGTAYWSVAALGTLLFIGSLLAHELGHSVVARRNDIEVAGITLWMFGGVAELRSEARTAGAELRIALAGPAMSLLVGAVSIGAALGLSQVGAPDLYVAALAWLGVVNVFLAVFNLLPGSPLDGGRVLAAVIWMVRGDRLQAKVWAARTGRVVALLIIAAGFAEVFVLQSGTGLWTVFIGWFLLSAARVEEAHYVGEAALGTMPVSAAMLQDPASVRTWATVDDAVRGPLASSSQSAVPVLDWNEKVVGVITMSQVRRLPADRWAATTVGDVMLPAAQLPTAMPTERLTSVLERLRATSGGFALVLDRGRLVGLLTPDGISRAISFGQMARRGGVPTPVTSGPQPPPAPIHVPTQRWEPPRSQP